MSLLLDDCAALVIDPSATSRNVLSAQLRDLGVGSVSQCSRLADARRKLESGRYDLVLCEMDFQEEGGRKRSGQDLLDELNRANLLPWSTIFVMVTTERSYAKVMEAAESALDAYLIKPFTAQVLRERITHARKRKKSLQGIYAAMGKGELDEAVRLCRQRFTARESYWLYVARLGAELQMRQGRHDEALRWLDEVLADQPLPWARLDRVRCLLARQQSTAALQALQSLIADEPGFVDAQDVLGRTLLGQGKLEEALQAFVRAVELTPGDLRRQQRLGMLACYLGDMATGSKALDRALVLGAQSKLFDDQSHVLLALARLRQRDSKALARCLTALDRSVEQADDPVRPTRLQGLVRALDRLINRQPEAAATELALLAEQRGSPGFDLEAGWNLLAGLSAAAGEGTVLPQAEEWVHAVALRFVGTRAAGELLAQAVATQPAWAERVRGAQHEITEAAEKALTHSVAGRPDEAVRALVAEARRSLNPKFLDTARGVMRRYEDQITERPAHEAALREVARLCGAGTAVSLPPGLEDFRAGGLRLRTVEKV